MGRTGPPRRELSRGLAVAGAVGDGPPSRGSGEDRGEGHREAAGAAVRVGEGVLRCPGRLAGVAAGLDRAIPDDADTLRLWCRRNPAVAILSGAVAVLLVFAATSLIRLASARQEKLEEGLRYASRIIAGHVRSHLDQLEHPLRATARDVELRELLRRPDDGMLQLFVGGDARGLQPPLTGPRAPPSSGACSPWTGMAGWSPSRRPRPRGAISWGRISPSGTISSTTSVARTPRRMSRACTNP